MTILTLRDLGLVGGGVLWTPAQISTALWLDAADASTITTVSGAVSQWNDKSGNDRNASQATAAQRPVVTTAALNGRNVVEFNPASNNWHRLDFTRLTSIGSIFFVAKKNNVNDSEVVLSDSTSDDLRSVSLGNAAGSNLVVQQINGTNTLATRNAWHIAEITTDGTNAVLGVDANRVTNAETDLMSSNTIGYYRNSQNQFVIQYSFRGQIAEIIFTVTVQSTDPRQLIEGYLAHKWGLTANLPSDHPYKTAPPLT